VADAQIITIPYSPRPQFAPFHERTQRWAAMVCHRRAGKTVSSINDLVKAAVTCPKLDPRFAYLAPYHAQAKDVAWDYLLKYSAPIPGAVPNISELRVDYPNRGRVRLYGAENAERLRGIYLDGIVIDEPADIDPRVWREIIRPALADRNGWAVFIGTPKGRNSFAVTCSNARQDPAWFFLELKASQTGILSDAELIDARKEMSAEQYAQEFECSFDAAVKGSYYGRLIDQAEAEGRITRVPYDPGLRVDTFWDLGIDDMMSIWFAQTVGRERRLIDYYENSGEALPHYVGLLAAKPYVYGDHFLPHDAKVRELGTGKSRVQTLADLGVKVTVLPADPIEDGIEEVRRIIPQCWFDAEKCRRGLECLKMYRQEWDEKAQTFRGRPLHDWASHGSDAFRTGAMGWRMPQAKLPPAPKEQFAGGAGGWMA
jgi:hypothetical protein